MGIINVTPDSFSDGGQLVDAERAVARALRMVEDGAAIIDVGGESTRPGADAVDVETELDRVMPVVEALASKLDGRAEISIDTTKAEVARSACGAGATIVNDVSASLEEVAADSGAGWVAMHRKGSAATMQVAPAYDDVVAEVTDGLADAVRRGRAAGVDRLWVDPGIGFGKTLDHNLDLLANLDDLAALDADVLVGVSRKSMIGRLHARSDGADEVGPDDRLEGSLALAVWAAYSGADVVRAHDVRATAQAVKVVG